MKLEVFHAGDGDCLLLTSGDDPPRRLLIDGGRKGSYEDHARDFLGDLAASGAALDVLCVSHIDDDHISGVLRLVEDEVAKARLEGRQGQPPLRPGLPFTFWFSSDEKTPGLTESREEHMKAIAALAADLRAGHEDVMCAPKFGRKGHLALEL